MCAILQEIVPATTIQPGRQLLVVATEEYLHKKLILLRPTVSRVTSININNSNIYLFRQSISYLLCWNPSNYVLHVGNLSINEPKQWSRNIKTYNQKYRFVNVGNCSHVPYWLIILGCSKVIFCFNCDNNPSC